MHITFLLSMVSVYLGKNKVAETATNNRDIKNRNFSLNDLQASFEQVK